MQDMDTREAKAWDETLMAFVGGLPPVLDESQRPEEDVYGVPPIEVPEDSQLPAPTSPVEIPASQPRDDTPGKMEVEIAGKDGEKNEDGKETGDETAKGDGMDGKETGDEMAKGDGMDGKETGDETAKGDGMDGKETGDETAKGDGMDGKTRDEKNEEQEVEEKKKPPAKPPTMTAAAVKTKPKKKIPEEGLKDLPMVTREAQQAQKKHKTTVSRMDAAEEAKTTAKSGGRKDKVFKRPSAKAKASSSRRQQSPAKPPAEPANPEVEMVESDSDDKEVCKNLEQEFAEAAETAEVKPKGRNGKRKGETDKEKPEEKTKKIPRKEKTEKAEKIEKTTEKKSEKPQKTEKTEGEETRKTFAGRRCPAENEDAIKRFQVIKKVFQEQILPKVQGPISALEARDINQKKLSCSWG